MDLKYTESYFKILRTCGRERKGKYEVVAVHKVRFILSRNEFWGDIKLFYIPFIFSFTAFPSCVILPFSFLYHFSLFYPYFSLFSSWYFTQFLFNYSLCISIYPSVSSHVKIRMMDLFSGKNHNICLGHFSAQRYFLEPSSQFWKCMGRNLHRYTLFI